MTPFEATIERLATSLREVRLPARAIDDGLGDILRHGAHLSLGE